MTVDVLFDAAAAGMSALAALTLIFRKNRAPNHLYLAGFFTSVFVWYAANVISWLGPEAKVLGNIIALPVLSVAAPCLWLYIRDLIAEAPKHIGGADFVHFLPLVFSILLVFAVLGLSPANRIGLFSDAPVSGEAPLLIASFLTVLLSVLTLQFAAYVGLSIWRLSALEKRVKAVFANTEARDLSWLKVLLGLMGLIFLTVLFSFWLRTPFIGDALLSAWDYILLTFFAFWGARQEPVFAPREMKAAASIETETEVPSSDPAKYEKSGLSEDQAHAVAQRIQSALKEDRLYLDPMLSLPMLARRVATPQHYVSQVLNAVLQKSFFDLVNAYRIEEACTRLKESRESVTEIALSVGFNSRSSFYTAFKRETGLSPGDYRKSAQSE